MKQKPKIFDMLVELKNDNEKLVQDQFWTETKMDLPPVVDEINDQKITITAPKAKHYEIQTITIFVSLNKVDKKKTYALVCKENEIIQTIKKKFIIDSQEKIEFDKLFLYHNNQICRNEKTLSSMKIFNNQILEAWIDNEHIINVNVKFNYGNVRKSTLQVDRYEPYTDFIWKRVIVNFFGEKKPYMKELLHGVLNGQILDDSDQRSLQQLGFINGCEFKFMLGTKNGRFPLQSNVIMSDGSIKLINEIQTGDYVLSYDQSLRKITQSRVVRIHFGLTLIFTVIEIQGQSITTTPDNPFLTEKGWKAVKPQPKYKIEQLTVKDKILNKDNQFVNIISITIKECYHRENVINIQTEWPYNFFINGLLVIYLQQFIEINIYDQIFQVEITSNMLIHNIKGMIEMKKGIKIEQQELYFKDKLLNDDELINNYVTDHQMLTLNLKIIQQPIAIKQKSPEIIQVKLVSNNQVVKFNLNLNISFTTLSEIIHQYLNIQNSEKSFLLCNGIIYDLANINNDIQALKLQNQSTIIMLTENNLSAIQFSYFLQNIKLESLKELRDSLSFLEAQQKLNQFINIEIDKLKKKEFQENSFYQQFTVHQLIAIKIWTSNLVYKQINIDLRSNKFDQWGKYLKCFLEAVNKCSYYKGTTYRGIKHYQNTEIYSKGKMIQWSEISCSSKDIDAAIKFSDNEGMLFELELISGKDIGELSIFQKEKEVIMLPFSQFSITSVTKKINQPIYVKLRELPQPRWSQILLWIDDNPENNFQYAQELEKENPLISVVFCTSTKDAIDVIRRSRFMIILDDQNVRIVTDMVRFEEGKWNYEAGIQFLKYLIDNFNYDYQVLIFCGDEKKAIDNCKKLNIIGNYIISNQAGVLKKFIRFQ